MGLPHYFPAAPPPQHSLPLSGSQLYSSRLDSERADSGWEGEERQVRQRKPLGVGSPGTAFEKAR